MLKILFFSYSFIAFTLGKKKFSFRRCRWKAINSKNWSQEHQDWILIEDNFRPHGKIPHPWKP